MNHSVRTLFCVLLFSFQYHLSAQSNELVLFKSNNPSKTRVVKTDIIKVFTSEGAIKRLENPLVTDNYLISNKDTIAIHQITRIVCASKANKSQKIFRYSAAVAGTGLVIAGVTGLGWAVGTNLTSFNANEPVTLPLIAIAAGTGLAVYGYSLVDISRPYNLGEKWQLKVTKRL